MMKALWSHLRRLQQVDPVRYDVRVVVAENHPANRQHPATRPAQLIKGTESGIESGTEYGTEYGTIVWYGV